MDSEELTAKEQALLASILERLRVEFAGETVAVGAIHMMNAPGGQYLWIQAWCMDGKGEPKLQTRSPIRRAQVEEGDVEVLAEGKASFITADWRTALGPGREPES